MNSEVLLGITGIAGTVLVGIAGFGASIYNTRKTASAARDLRLRDQRSEVYVEAIASLNYRQLRRDLVMRRHALEPEVQARVQAYLDKFQLPEPYLLEARLSAFGSEKVHTAILKGSEAEQRAWACFEDIKKAAPGSDDERKAIEAWREQRKTANDADDTAIELIRTELQGSGPALGGFQAIPPDEAW